MHIVHSSTVFRCISFTTPQNSVTYHSQLHSIQLHIVHISTVLVAYRSQFHCSSCTSFTAPQYQLHIVHSSTVFNCISFITSHISDDCLYLYFLPPKKDRNVFFSHLFSTIFTNYDATRFYYLHLINHSDIGLTLTT
jgi:hypothetical protein